MERPPITTLTTGAELRKWYWLKSELLHFAKIRGVSTSGSKFQLLQRLAGSLDGAILTPEKKSRADSKFDWSTAELTPETLITDSYKNGENTRAFFRKHCGNKFRFSIPFMDWMKAHVGESLQQAVGEWHRLQAVQSQKDFASQIPAGNQYNKYLRDFFRDNPNRSMAEARHFWKLKRALPLGLHVYEKSDLALE